MVRHPFYDNGPNDKGIGLQLGASLGRLMVGYVVGSAVAIMLGVTLGLSPVLYRAVNPYIQVLKPVSPLAWMPLFLYTLKDSGQSAILVIFMSSLWPTLANTASASPRSSATTQRRGDPAAQLASPSGHGRPAWRRRRRSRACASRSAARGSRSSPPRC
jgi:ABC-type nitrate/sulfonate/bicarbonate transport system permease component